MSQRLFWLNIGLFILVPLSVLSLLLLTRPGHQAGRTAPAAFLKPVAEAAPAGHREDRVLPDEEMPGREEEIITCTGGWLTKMMIDPGQPRFYQQSGFIEELAVTGAIGYFNGQANLQGQTFPDQPHRFLAQEQIRIDMYFSAEPREITVTINDIQRKLAGIPGRRYYWTSFILPEWPSTLDWDGTRLADPYLLQVTAISRSDPAMTAMALVDDIEITGNVMSRVHVQPN